MTTPRTDPAPEPQPMADAAKVEAGTDELSAAASSVGASNAEAPNAEISSAEAVSAIKAGATEPGATVPVPQPPLMVVYHTLAFAFSALLSPYLVIPLGTVGIVASQPAGARQLILWTTLSVLFSTGIPAIYVVIQILRGKITDVHVMEREQRGGPFLVAVASSFIGAVILRAINAPPEVWSIGIVLGVNGIILSWITSFWKISMHVAVLSATVLAAVIVIPGVGVWRLIWLIPALIWARVTRGRHSIGQGLAACVVACLVTGTVLYFSMNLWPKILRAFGLVGTMQS